MYWWPANQFARLERAHSGASAPLSSFGACAATASPPANGKRRTRHSCEQSNTTENFLPKRQRGAEGRTDKNVCATLTSKLAAEATVEARGTDAQSAALPTAYGLPPESFLGGIQRGLPPTRSRARFVGPEALRVFFALRRQQEYRWTSTH